jgi:hypothetical protein
MQRFKKTLYLEPSIISFTEDIKMWMIHCDMLEIFVILQLKQYQGHVLVQDIELCPFCYFPVNITGKKEGKSLDFTFFCLLLFFFC